MKYYDINGKELDEKSIDLKHGYLEDREVVHHKESKEKYHREKYNGRYVKVVDTPASPEYDEVVSQTYIFTGATLEERVESNSQGIEELAELIGGMLE